MTQAKKLIEVALPLEAINKASGREKSIRRGHPSTLHLWWSRKPLATARAVIFTSIVDDPEDPNALPAFVEACKKLPKGANVDANGDTPRMRLFDFIERFVTWEATTDEAILNTARELIQIATEGNPPPLLDPFAGGGSIPLEAQRLGLEAHASDLNPVAVMINKAQIEIPPRFADMPPVNPRDREKMFGKVGKVDTTWKGAAGLASDVRYYGEWIRNEVWNKIGHLYPSHNGDTVIAWLWAQAVKCPNPTCTAHIPLINSYWLDKKKGRRSWIVPEVDKNNQTLYYKVQSGNIPKEHKKTIDAGTGYINDAGRKARTTFVCPICNDGIVDGEYIDKKLDLQDSKIIPLAIVTEAKGGRTYSDFDQDQTNVAILEAQKYWEKHELYSPPQAARGTFASNAQGRMYGYKTYGDYFTVRQNVAIGTFISTMDDLHTRILEDAILAKLESEKVPLKEGGTGAYAYAEAVSLYLMFALDKAINMWSSLTSWMNDRGALRETFARQGIAMVWGYAEANPFSNSGGNFLMGVDRVSDAIDYFPVASKGTAQQLDATNVYLPNNTFVSTDPPYYDNIGYADLTDFFYVWMREALRKSYPDIFGTMLVPKGDELFASAYRFEGDQNAANQHFEYGIQKTFEMIRNQYESNIPITVYYAFKQTDQDSDQYSSTGWEIMLKGLIDSGFKIVGTWPIRTESSGRSVAQGTNALASSILLVCRPRLVNSSNTSRRAFMDELRRELPEALKEMQSGNIAPVDLAQASIGPGMAIYSRYSKVLEADGTPMSVRTALGLINQALDEYLAEQDGDIEPDTRFAIDWFKQFGFEEGEFGLADVLARAKNTSVAGVEAAGVVESGRGKVKLRHWSEYDPGAWDPTQDKRPTVWEATHHLIERLNSHGEEGSALLLNKMPSDMAAEARQLAYRLYSICERKGWADHARDYNALVVSWSGIGEVAAQQRELTASGDKTSQMGLGGEFDD